MERLLESKPSVRFEVEKVIGVSEDGNYQVQWAPAWVSKFHLVGCEHLIQEFLQQQVDEDSEYPTQVAVLHSKDKSMSLTMSSETCSGSSEIEEAVQISSSDDINNLPEFSNTSSSVHKFPGYDHSNILHDEIYVKVEDTTQEKEEVEDIASQSSVGDNESPHQINSYSTSDPSLLDTNPTSGTMSAPTHSVSDALSESSVMYDTVDPSSYNAAPNAIECSDVSNTMVVLTHNLATKKPPKYFCSVCGKDCWTPSNLAIHMRTHTGERPFQCSLCDKSFARNDTLKKHERTHSGEKPYQCLYCGMNFSRNDVLKEHIRLHTGDKRHSCMYCGRLFFKKAEMEKHYRVHTGERPFECETCGKSFTTKSTLKSHLILHKKKDDNSDYLFEGRLHIDHDIVVP